MARVPRLARPCSARGSDFEERADGTLYCSSCREVVHDLTKATRSDASRLYRDNGGKLCGVVRTWPGGDVRFAPEPPRRGLVAAASGAALAVAMAGCGDDSAPPLPPVHVVDDPAPPPTAPVPAAPTPTVTAAAPDPDTVEAPPPVEPTAVADEDDASPRHADHLDHAHRHPPVHIGDDTVLGGLEGL